MWVHWFSHPLLTPAALLILFFLTAHPIHQCWNCSVIASAIWCPNYCSACCINVLDNRDVGRGATRRVRHFEGQACSVNTIYNKALQDAKSHVQEMKKPGHEKTKTIICLGSHCRIVTGVGFYSSFRLDIPVPREHWLYFIGIEKHNVIQVDYLVILICKIKKEEQIQDDTKPLGWIPFLAYADIGNMQDWKSPY